MHDGKGRLTAPASIRLHLALESGLALPLQGRIAVFHPVAGTDLSMLPKDRVTVIQPVFPDHAAFSQAGYASETAPPESRFAAALVCLPRAKDRARQLIAEAVGITDGPVIVDGAKTDGVDSILREVRKRVEVGEAISKAHGKLFWFEASGDVFADWLPKGDWTVGRFRTAPGVFSADGIDPASEALAHALPAHLGAHVADLGGGWGYLSDHLLQDDKLKTLDLVEADRIALDCARANLDDPRMRFHWADARTWTPEAKLDAVVMNPPFHTARAADPELGRDFIRAAARILHTGGRLWMVANRHLPYESVLRERFGSVEDVGGDSRFKIVCAQRPLRIAR